MRAYKNEAAFSKAFCGRLRSLGYVVTRIESGGTRSGIPDIHWAGCGQEGWVELKNIKRNYYNRPVKIPWRPGQQAWAFDYATATGQCVVTAVAFCNGILLIPMVRHFKENWVMPDDGELLTDLRGLKVYDYDSSADA
jgi:hypothetical protein